MRKFSKWVGLVPVSLVVIYFKTEKRLTRVYELPEEMIAIPPAAASIERGKHIFQFRGCQARHST